MSVHFALEHLRLYALHLEPHGVNAMPVLALLKELAEAKATVSELYDVLGMDFRVQAYLPDLISMATSEIADMKETLSDMGVSRWDEE